MVLAKATMSSGKCQIIHWRQGHKDDCRPAAAFHTNKEGECIVETARENQFAMHSKTTQKFVLMPVKNLTILDLQLAQRLLLFFHGTSESSSDASISEVVENSARPDKAPSVGIDSHMSQTVSDSDDADVPSPSLPVYSGNHPPWGSKVEKTLATKTDESLKSTSFKDKRRGDGVAVLEEIRLGAIELRSSQSSSSVRTSSAEDWRNLAQMSTSKVTRSFKASGNHQMPNLEPSSECSKSLKMPPSDEYWKNESQVCNSNGTRLKPTFKSSGNCQKLPIKTDSPHVISSEIEGVRNLSQDTRKSLKTSVRKFVQHFREPKQSKSYTFDMVKDSGGNFNQKEAGVSGSLAEDSTLIGLTFGGYLRSKIKCMKCLGRSERFDRMMDLTVEIDGNIYTLEEALAQFTTSETLGGDDKYKCSRCKSYEKAKKKLTVLEAPNILTIVLKRFRSGNLEKLNKLVKFPEVLNLSPYMSGMSDKYPIYHLYAVVVHLGLMNAAYSGHYVSYVKDFRGDWFRIDDSRKKNSKTKLNLSGRNTESTLPHQVSDKHPDWMSPSDFTGDHVVDPDGWGFQSKHRNLLVDSSSDSSSIFSASDAGSYSTDSTKDSSAEEISGYLFGSSWYNP
ncbi:LOW QUALITY PROTEIN: hypothetical protein DH2020_015283 [Rehmannia glutinosa]|uniref:USP domain-containing protein n=1 Tax=Rehmannia glutinosa TaxID=99300 RepID=A0ABR0WSR9_REHGL